MFKSVFKRLIVVVFIFSTLCTSAQNKYDTIFSFTPGSGSGFFPNCVPILGQDGLIYGTAERGGANQNGTIYSFNPSTNKFIVVHNFIEGRSPLGAIAQARDGKIYGTTRIGTNQNSQDGDGSFYQYDPQTGIIRYIKFFNTTDCFGYNPWSGVTIASNGSVFGTTYLGGPNEGGSIFEYIPGKDTIICRWNLAGSTQSPSRNIAPLVQYDQNHLLGVSIYGGQFSSGCLFKYNLKTDSVTIVHSFTSGWSKSSMVKSSNGTYYGSTYGGTIYKYDGTYTKLVETADGFAPNSNMVDANNGKLYGMAQWAGGGASQAGIIYEYDIKSNVYTDSIVMFSGNNGYWPNNYGLLYYAPNRSIYGTTYLGGATFGKNIGQKTGHGVFFKFTPTPIIPKISNFTSSQAVGTPLTIRGKGFSSTPSENAVTFGGGIQVMADQSTDTSLTVTIPWGALTGTIVVTSRGVQGPPSTKILTTLPGMQFENKDKRTCLPSDCLPHCYGTNSSCPVIYYQGVQYWPTTPNYQANFYVVGCKSQTVVSKKLKEGIRYIYDVTIDYENQKINFYGVTISGKKESVAIKWNEL